MSLDVCLIPNKCHHCGRSDKEDFSANITHNLNKMAMEAGIYEILWRPEKVGIVKAKQIIEPLKAGIALMEANPIRFKAFDAPNKWGTYEQFIPWLKRYLAACIEYPEDDVEVSR